MLKNNFIARYYALWKVKVLENVFSAIICSFAVNNWSNLWRYWNQMFALFPAAIFVLLRGAQIWHPHSEPYKFLLHILKNNSVAENCINVRLGQVVNLWYQHSIIPESFGFRHSTVLILVFDGVIVKTTNNMIPLHAGETSGRHCAISLKLATLAFKNLWEVAL